MACTAMYTVPSMYTGHQWIPLKEDQQCEPEQAVGTTLVLPVIRNVMALM